MGLAVFDPAYHLILWNGLFESYTGLPPGALRRGSAAAEVLVWSLSEREPAPGRDLWEGRWELENGRTVEAEKLERDDGGFTVLIKDVTPIVEAETAIAQAERRLLDITAVASDWFWETDEDDRFTYLSYRFYELTGATPEFLIGRSRLEIADPDDMADEPEKWRVYRETVERRLPFRDFVYTIRTTSFGSRVLKISGRPYRHPDGRFAGYRGTGTDITVETAARAEAERAEDALHQAIEAINDGFVLWDEQDRLVICNEKFRDLWGAAIEDVRPGRSFSELLSLASASGFWGHHDEEWVRQRLARHLKPAAPVEHRSSDGRWLRISEHLTPSGQRVGIYTDITDVKERESRAREAMLAERNALLQATLDNIAEGLAAVDRHDRLVAWNQIFVDFLNARNVMPQVGTSMGALEALSERLGLVDLIHAVRAGVKAGDRAAARGIVREANRADGRIVELRGTPMPGDGVVIAVADVTERRKAIRWMEHLATHDSLTGLGNRYQFHRWIVAATERARARGEYVGLLFFDLDNFKDVNDTLGHAVGDVLLVKVAERLIVTVGVDPHIARLGGDEFAIVVSGIEDPDQVEAMAAKVCEVLARPFELEDRKIGISASIGITLFPRDTADPSQMLPNADLAMYRAKAEARGHYRFFTATMVARALNRRAIEEDLRAALDENHFLLWYQPKVDLTRGEVIGAEALIRWRRRGFNLVGPAEFIPVAEAAGLIEPIGRWTVASAAREARQWLEDGLPVWNVAVNVSAIQLMRGDCVETIQRLLEESGLPPRYLEIEITEGTLMSDVEGAIAVLKRLNDLGVEISIDDFGTGYSSLGYLKRFPIHKIKLDQTFVRHLPADSDSKAIARAIISMGHALKMKVVAEGVETEAQLSFLIDEGCDQAQGYHFSRPLPAAEFRSFVQNGGKLLKACWTGPVI